MSSGGNYNSRSSRVSNVSKSLLITLPKEYTGLFELRAGQEYFIKVDDSGGIYLKPVHKLNINI